MKHIGIISEDIIFYKLLETFLIKKITDVSIAHFDSFSDISNRIDSTNNQIILIDGIMSGVASFEIITYLRYTKNISCPIFFFSEVGQEFFKTKAYFAGANRYYEKPFDHHTVTDEIIAELENQEQELLKQNKPIQL